MEGDLEPDDFAIYELSLDEPKYPQGELKYHFVVYQFTATTDVIAYVSSDDRPLGMELVPEDERAGNLKNLAEGNVMATGVESAKRLGWRMFTDAWEEKHGEPYE